MASARQEADASHRAWMQATLERAASRLGVSMAGEPRFGWRDRSVGVRAEAPAGSLWLRVVSEQAAWIERDFWTGNVDAGAIEGIPKPRVLRTCEWDDASRRVRAELMTLVDGKPCSASAELRRPAPAPADWWNALRRSLDVLSGVRTERVRVSQARVTRLLRVFFGEAIDPRVGKWETAHGDLHWGNLMCPQLAVLDWEMWGTAPAGLDAATLHCYSLLTPEVARRIHETFADVLDTPDGIRARLYATARLLLRAERGDHPDLILPLHRAAREALQRAPSEKSRTTSRAPASKRL